MASKKEKECYYKALTRKYIMLNEKAIKKNNELFQKITQYEARIAELQHKLSKCKYVAKSDDDTDDFLSATEDLDGESLSKSPRKTTRTSKASQLNANAATPVAHSEAKSTRKSPRSPVKKPTSPSKTTTTVTANKSSASSTVPGSTSESANTRKRSEPSQVSEGQQPLKRKSRLPNEAPESDDEINAVTGAKSRQKSSKSSSPSKKMSPAKSRVTTTESSSRSSAATNVAQEVVPNPSRKSVRAHIRGDDQNVPDNEQAHSTKSSSRVAAQPTPSTPTRASKRPSVQPATEPPRSKAPREYEILSSEDDVSVSLSMDKASVLSGDTSTGSPSDWEPAVAIKSYRQLDKSDYKKNGTQVQCLIENCNEYFQSDRYIDHVNAAHMELRWPCPFCDKKYCYRRGVQTHCQARHPEKRLEAAAIQPVKRI